VEVIRETRQVGTDDDCVNWSFMNSTRHQTLVGDQIKKSEMSVHGHVLLRGEVRTGFFLRKAGGKRPPGRPRRRWG